MFKKLVITGAAAALMMVSAVPAFASHHSSHQSLPTSTTGVVNSGSINNTSVDVANTGLNYGSSSHSRHSTGGVTTGNAVALQSTDNEINTVAGCGCSTTGNSATYVSNTGNVSNQSWNVANTGLNGGSSVHTGNAAAGQDVYNAINTGVTSE